MQRISTSTRALGACVVLVGAIACGDDDSPETGNPAAPEPLGGGGGSSGGSSQSGAGGTDVEAGDNDREPVDACVSACRIYVEQCASDDPCEITCDVWRMGFPECQPEYDAYFACLEALGALTFDCSEDFVIAHVEACATKSAMLWYCDRAEGMQCRHEPALDASCAAGTPKPPNYTYCRYDVTPEDCVPHNGSIGDAPPLGWCCP